MALQRLLKLFNYCLAVALLSVLACAYWFAWRPLPKTSGAIGAPVADRASVTRDSLGVPHILAASQPDALFLQGYVTAQDRLFQMDAMRRLAAGELAEVLGRGALESDREARRLRLWRVAEEHARRLPASDRAAFAAYARGVNFFLENNHNRLPLEFTLLRYDPRPWSVADSVLIALHMMSTLERELAVGPAQGDAGSRRGFEEGGLPVRKRFGRRKPAGLQRLGGLGRAHRLAPPAARRRPASGILPAFGLAHGPPARASIKR